MCTVLTLWYYSLADYKDVCGVIMRYESDTKLAHKVIVCAFLLLVSLSRFRYGLYIGPRRPPASASDETSPGGWCLLELFSSGRDHVMITQHSRLTLET